jgi:hypothetical protein
VKPRNWNHEPRPWNDIRKEATGGGLRERVELLEADKMADESRLAREALTYVSNEDLRALEAVVEARDRGAPWEEIYRTVRERGCRVQPSRVGSAAAERIAESSATAPFGVPGWCVGG